MNIVIFGPPGAGKGTQANRVKDHYGLIHLSTGDVFRNNIKDKSELGLLAKSYMDKGELVPDSVTIKMLEAEVNNYPNSSGFIFDGFPRTKDQAIALDVFLSLLDTKVSMMVALSVPADELIQRLLLRGKDSGRVDDQDEEVIANRIRVYEEKTAVLANYYNSQSKLASINGVGSIDDITQRIYDVLDN